MKRHILLSDQELLADYRAGSIRAGELLFRRYSMLVERYIRAHVRDVDDIYNLRQDVMLRILNGLRTSYHETGRLLPWVMTIAVNVVNDYYRHRSKEPELVLDELSPSLLSSEELSDDLDHFMRYERAYTSLERIYKNLPIEDRSLIYSLFYENQSFRQAAMQRGVSKSSCFKYFQRLLFRLRRMLKESGVDRDFLEER